MHTLTLFVRSTGDVRDERLAVGRVVEKLQARHWRWLRLEMVPADLAAAPVAASGNADPLRPADCDLFVGILGSRLDPPAAPPARGREGARGIEHELEEAARAGGEGKPGLLIYRRAGEAADGGSHGSGDELGRKLEDFCERFFSIRDSGPRREFVPFATTDEFAGRFEQDLEARIRRERERHPELADAVLTPLAGPPYPGDAALDYDDAPRFFGRDRPIAEALAQLKRNHAAGNAFLLIYGAPGCGKSSLARAGLAPRLTADGYLPDAGAWCGTTVRASENGARPLETLARALVGALPELEKLRDTSGAPPAPAVRPSKGKKGRKAKATAEPAPPAGPVWDGPRLAHALETPEQRVFAIAAIVAALDRLSSAKPAHFLLLVDPLDDCFTAREIGPETRDVFFEVLAALAASRRIWVVATLGSGLFPRVAEHRALFQLVRHDGGFFLGAPEVPDLRALIRGPALAAGLEFEVDPESGRELSEQILADAVATRGALPWLAKTLDALYQQRDGTLLTASAYQALAGSARPTDALPPGDEEPATIRRRERRLLRGFQAAAVVLAAAGIATALLGQRRQADLAAAAEIRSRQAADDTRHARAAASLDAGAARLAGGAPDEALPFLIDALENDPRQLDAQALLVATLRRVAWHFPIAELAHPLPVSQLAFGDDEATLFTATDAGGDGFSTTLRWHLPDATIQAVGVPATQGPTHALSLAPGGRRVLVQRGDGPSRATFLCDAESLQPLKVLPVATDLPAACLAWSREGALLAYPTGTGDARHWVIADAASGETIRHSGSVGDPLAAQLDRQRLRAIHREGTLVDLPLSSAVPERRASASTGGPILEAALNPDGSEFLARVTLSEGGTTRRFFAVIDTGTEFALGIEAAGTSPRASWFDAPPLREAAGPRVGPRLPATYAIDGDTVHFTDAAGGDPLVGAPLQLDGAVTAVAFQGSLLAAATTSGRLSVHRLLPRPDEPLKHGGAAIVADAEGWTLFRTLARGARLESRDHELRLIPADGAAVPLRLPEDWVNITAAALSPDGRRLVMAGVDWRNREAVPSGLVIADAGSGSPVSGVEPLDACGRIVFLEDGQRIAVTGRPGVRIFDLTNDLFQTVATLPVAGASDLFALPGGARLAVAGGNQVSLFDLAGFSRIATLPGHRGTTASGGPRSDSAWAVDSRGDWLAFASEGVLNLWSTRSGHRLLGDLAVAAGPLSLAFADEKGIRGLRLAGASEGFIPLAKLDGLEPAELADLRVAARAFAGTGLAADGRTVVRLPPAERRAALAGESTGLPGLFDARPAHQAMLAAPAVASGALTWLPLWERLAAMPEVDPSRLLERAAGLGEHPWFQHYLHGEIARVDHRLALAWKGERDPAAPDTGKVPAADPGIGRLHQLAGDPAGVAELKRAAWLAARTAPKRLATVLLATLLADPENLKDLPGIDAEKVRALDPAALEALRAARHESQPDHWSVRLLDDHAGRAEAMTRLDASVEATGKRYEAAPSPARAIDHAEALAWRGESAAAAEFLAGKVPADTVLTLRQAHGLLSFGLDEQAPEALDLALDAHQSPWLWQQWLQVRRAAGDPLAPLAARVMTAVDGRGPAAVEALRTALLEQDAEAIAACLRTIKGLPESLGVYATGVLLWAQDEKAKAFALWPDRFPDLRAEVAAGDWQGWEAALPENRDGSLFAAMEQELATLVAGPDASLDDQRALATRLLEPATTATFGIKRVREAMVTCALALASDPDSAPLVGPMLDRARLAGAPNAACLRIEARMSMAEGNFTAAYSRWLQLIDAADAEILASDYLEAAACVIEDLQDAAAIELLLRGKTKFPADSTFAFDSAWLLLTTAHPEEAGILLDHGFTIPFTEEQHQTALAMLLCAAEQTGRVERADQAFQDLFEISGDWGDEESIRSLEWPEALTENLLAVAERNR
jgi:hypothetical protein